MYVLCSCLCSPHFNNFKWWAGNITNSTFYMLKEFHVEGLTPGVRGHIFYIPTKFLHSSTSSFCLIITFTWLSHTMWTVGKKCVQILTKTSLCPIQILSPGVENIFSWLDRDIVADQTTKNYFHLKYFLLMKSISHTGVRTDVSQLSVGRCIYTWTNVLFSNL